MKRHPPAVEAMVADAAALAQVIAWEDFRRGFVIVSEPLPARLSGLAAGQGVELAEAHGERCGRGSVWIDPEKFTRGADYTTPDMVARFTEITLHELAHAVTWDDYPDADAAMAAAHQSTTTLEYTAELLATWHCPRWAGACAVLLSRAAPLRRPIADAIRDNMAADVARYGFELAAVVDAVKDFPARGRIRDVLAPGGEWERRLMAVVPALESRLATCVDSGWPRATVERVVA